MGIATRPSRVHVNVSPADVGRSAPVVVHVTTTDMSLELLLGPQLEAIRRAGYAVYGASAPGPHVSALEARGIPHLPLRHATRAMAPFTDARALSELLKLFRRLRPTIVHTHNPKPGWYGRLAAHLARVPVVVNTVHGLYATEDDSWAKRAVVYGLERAAATCSDAELLQNAEDRPVLRRLGVPQDRLIALGNGIDLTRFNPARISAAQRATARADLGAQSNDDVVIGSVGRLVREKGYPELFAAARLLRGEVGDVRVVIVGGDDPDKPDALDAIDRQRAADAGVRFLGHREDVEALYAGMDVLVLASHREGFPRAPMEAAAMGVPTIATDIRGCRQAVDDGVTGRLVPVGDIEALARAMHELATDREQRRRLGRAARQKALREFDVDRCVEVTLATYGRLLADAALPLPSPGHRR